jgi:hypothetical protein
MRCNSVRVAIGLQRCPTMQPFCVHVALECRWYTVGRWRCGRHCQRMGCVAKLPTVRRSGACCRSCSFTVVMVHLASLARVVLAFYCLVDMRLALRSCILSGCSCRLGA